jgi:hypothetical protein
MFSRLTFLKWLMMPLFSQYVRMPGRSFKGTLPELTAGELLIAHNCKQHIQRLSAEIGERHAERPEALSEAATYIEEIMVAAGYQVSRHEAPSMQNSGENIIAESEESRLLAGPVFVIGAHYDTIFGCRGANDNGSGVAALLEILKHLSGKKLRRRVQFVAFANEEHPGKLNETMGSLAYARSLQAAGQAVAGMWSLETIGFYSSDKGSQRYPFPFNLYYPDEGNFVAFVGNTASRSFVHESIRAFRKSARFPSEGVTAPEKFKDIGRSDHWGFWMCDFPALMITDTANFRYAHYHTPDDTADKVDYPALARVTNGLAETAVQLLS